MDFSPLELDVLVHEDGDAHGYQGEEDAGHEHDAEARDSAQDGQGPRDFGKVELHIEAYFDRMEDSLTNGST